MLQAKRLNVLPSLRGGRDQRHGDTCPEGHFRYSGIPYPIPVTCVRGDNYEIRSRFLGGCFPVDDIRRRLHLGRAGKKVRQVEDDVIAALDKLIEDIEKNQQQSSSSGGGAGGGDVRAVDRELEHVELQSRTQAVDGEVAGREMAGGDARARLTARGGALSSEEAVAYLSAEAERVLGAAESD